MDMFRSLDASTSTGVHRNIINMASFLVEYAIIEGSAKKAIEIPSTR